MKKPVTPCPMEISTLQTRNCLKNPYGVEGQSDCLSSVSYRSRFVTFYVEMNYQQNLKVKLLNNIVLKIKEL